MASDGSVVVTAAGVRSPLGAGLEAFSEAVRREKAATTRPYGGGHPDNSVPYYPLSDSTEIDALARRQEPLGALTSVVVGEALERAGLPAGDGPLDSVGLVMNIAFGPSLALERYLERLHERGPRGARPAGFVDTLLSMPASRAGIAHGLRGSSAALAGSSAIELARDWVRSGREETVVAGGGEWLSPKCLRHHRALAERAGIDAAPLAQAAAFVVLEREEAARQREAPVLARLLGTGAASCPQTVAVPWGGSEAGGALADAMRAALGDAGREPGDARVVVLAAGDAASEEAELAAVREIFGSETDPCLIRPKRLLGEALGAAETLGLLAAIVALEGEGVALVNSVEMGGAVTSLVVEALRS